MVAPAIAHETAPPLSCDSELRLLLDTRGQLEHYRLLLLAAGCLVGLLVVLIGCLSACLPGCCPACRREAPQRNQPAAKKGDRDLLALLAAAEVRR